MIRLFREDVGALLLLTLCVKVRGDNPQTVLTRNAITAQNLTPDAYEFVLRTLEDWAERGPYSADALIESLTAQLKADNKRANRQEGDLIDRIVDICKLPFNRNLMASQLSQLKKTLLLPEEQVASAAVQKQEYACINCQHKFRLGELVTFYQNEGQNVLYCNRCVKPSYIACSGCEQGHTALPKPLYNALAKEHDCGHATRAQQEEADEAIRDAINQPPPPMPQIAFDEAMENVRRAVQAQVRARGTRITPGDPFRTVPMVDWGTPTLAPPRMTGRGDDEDAG